jgi:thiosulfate dehydrogenase [quinone] large subunit
MTMPYPEAPTITAQRALALLRIGVGFEFGIWAWDKTRAGWLVDGSGLAELLLSFIPQSQRGYADFLESVVLPNVDLFARLVTLGEWVAAAALTLGLFTRAGSLVGMWLLANFMLMRGLFDVSGSIDRLFFAVCLICLVASAGEVWGLDRLRTRALPARNRWANPRTAASTANLTPRARNGRDFARETTAYGGLAAAPVRLQRLASGR